MCPPPTHPPPPLQALLDGAKREMWKTEKLASVNPKRYTYASLTTALILDLLMRFREVRPGSGIQGGEARVRFREVRPRSGVKGGEARV